LLASQPAPSSHTEFSAVLVDEQVPLSQLKVLQSMSVPQSLAVVHSGPPPDPPVLMLLAPAPPVLMLLAPAPPVLMLLAPAPPAPAVSSSAQPTRPGVLKATAPNNKKPNFSFDIVFLPKAAGRPRLNTLVYRKASAGNIARIT